MGNCVGGFKRRTHRIAPWKRNKPIVLCFIGIDGAGKTTIVKALQGEDFGTVHSTVGFSRAELRVKKYRITVYDLGGSARIREIWPIYFAEVFGVVFVLDASAASRISENKKMVDSLVGLPDLLGKPILFLLNKKDLPEALDEMQFSERFNLHSMAKQNKTDIRVEGICAVKGTGKEIDQVIVEGLEWLIEKVLDNYDNISKGVEKALKELKERQAQERLQRQHRLALSSSKESPEAAGTPENGDQEEEEAEEGFGRTKDEKAEQRDEAKEQRHRNNSEEGTNDGTLCRNIQEDKTETQRPNAQNGGIDYGVFEISSKQKKEDDGTIGEGRVNETMTLNDEGKEGEEEKEGGEKRMENGEKKEREEVERESRGREGTAEGSGRESRRKGKTAERSGRESRGKGETAERSGRESRERGGTAEGSGRESRGKGEAAERSGRESRGRGGTAEGSRRESRGRGGTAERSGREVQAVQQGTVEIEMRQTGRAVNSRGGSTHQQNAADVMTTVES
ncbi:hypothetical protein niasHT_015479 [Heterodera trifolii]|uniref:Uncharacterized protein n=1 Tax=Heterodera trifolii TaxID=157864 RepID=A0ABD2L013_9BILA